jgi:dephospho-CoA kinase
LRAPAARRGTLAVGLTGGIASGKSLVARYFEREGIPVIDADTIAHELIRPGAACYRGMLRLFGRGVVGARGRIVRRRVAAIIFARPALRRALNALMHPHILREAERRARRLSRAKKRPIVAVSAALLVEAGAARRFDRLVLVACRRAVQIRRLRKRDRLSLAGARARLRAQIGDACRRKVADHVIDNSGSPAATREQTHRVAEELRNLARRRGLRHA